MAATNRPEMLDPALLRPGGSTGRWSWIGPISRGARPSSGYIGQNVRLGAGRGPQENSDPYPRFCRSRPRESRQRGGSAGREEGARTRRPSDFDEAIDRMVGGLEKKNRVMSPREKEIVAFHESGHALVAESVATPIRFIRSPSSPADLQALGYTQQRPGRGPLSYDPSGAARQARCPPRRQGSRRAYLR